MNKNDKKFCCLNNNNLIVPPLCSALLSESLEIITNYRSNVDYIFRRIELVRLTMDPKCSVLPVNIKLLENMILRGEKIIESSGQFKRIFFINQNVMEKNFDDRIEKGFTHYYNRVYNDYITFIKLVPQNTDLFLNFIIYAGRNCLNPLEQEYFEIEIAKFVERWTKLYNLLEKAISKYNEFLKYVSLKKNYTIPTDEQIERLILYIEERNNESVYISKNFYP